MTKLGPWVDINVVYFKFENIYGKSCFYFRPSENDEEKLRNKKYVDAEVLGKNGNDCKMIYPNCSFPILDYISNKFF